MQDNNYPTYAQMYQRAVGANGKMVLQNEANGNDAIPRAVADDLVTLPEEWANAHPFTPRKRLYDALNATGAAKVGLPTGMLTQAGLTQAPKCNGSDEHGYTTKNKDFKPKAKQVFAALNYGRRPHGSNRYYGWSHLVLKPNLKINALYYPQDTFMVANSGHGTRSQAGYYTLGDLMEYAHNGLMDDLWRSCIQGQDLPDTTETVLMIEAHLFTTIKVNRMSRRCYSRSHSNRGRMARIGRPTGTPSSSTPGPGARETTSR